MKLQEILDFLKFSKILKILLNIISIHRSLQKFLFYLFIHIILHKLQNTFLDVIHQMCILTISYTVSNQIEGNTI